jgi:hypothetical protein
MLAKRLVRTATMNEEAPNIAAPPPDVNIDAMSEDEAWNLVCRLRWPASDGRPRCPKCGGVKAYTLGTRRVFRCAAHSCQHQFSPLSGTMFASFKKGYRGVLAMLAYDGPVQRAPANAKSAIDWRRRKMANQTEGRDE